MHPLYLSSLVVVFIIICIKFIHDDRVQRFLMPCFHTFSRSNSFDSFFFFSFKKCLKWLLIKFRIVLFESFCFIANQVIQCLLENFDSASKVLHKSIRFVLRPSNTLKEKCLIDHGKSIEFERSMCDERAHITTWSPRLANIVSVRLLVKRCRPQLQIGAAVQRVATKVQFSIATGNRFDAALHHTFTCACQIATFTRIDIG